MRRGEYAAAWYNPVPGGVVKDGRPEIMTAPEVRAMLDSEPEDVLLARSARAIGIEPEAVRGLRLARRSLDARKRSTGRRGSASRQLRFIVHVDLDLDPEFRSAASVPPAR